MPENPLARFFLIAALCIALFLGALIATWNGSATFRERVIQLGLLIPVSQVRFVAADALKGYPSQNSALALVAFLNLGPKIEEMDHEAAQEALASLCLLSGQAFGTGFKGTRNNYGWGPPSREDWPEVLVKVNLWAAETFGAAALESMAQMAEEGELHIEINGQPYVPPQ